LTSKSFGKINAKSLEENMSGNHKKHRWRVAVISNIKDKKLSQSSDLPPDAFAEFDSIETVYYIQNAIETDGHKTVMLTADKSLPHTLEEHKPDICFNIAEGLGGDAREAQTPALLELMNIPYTHSRILANAVSLDKTLTKRIWRDHGLPTTSFQEFVTGEEALVPALEFPLFAKPAHEGSGMGIDGNSVIESEDSLRRQIKYIIETYKQPALVETYLPGREFTVGILGGPHTREFSRHPEWYDKAGYRQLPVLEVDSTQATTPGIYSYEAKAGAIGEQGVASCICPADIDPVLANKLKNLGLQAHITLGVQDISRVDIRLDQKGEPQLMEINPLPGLKPHYSDICTQTEADGIKYEDLILEILYLAAGRWGLLEPLDLPL